MLRLLLLPVLFALSASTGGHAAGAVKACLVDTGDGQAGPIRDNLENAAAKIGAAIEVNQAGATGETDHLLAVDRFVAEACSLIVVTPGRSMLVLSVADGPMPDTRLAMQIARELGHEDVVVLVRDLDLNSDPELHQLIKQEMRELMSSSGLPGDTIPFERCTPECRGEVFLPGT
jgi:hypothetical protein